ncbi:co-chaperone GroES [Paraclostridium dentum]|uniref:co-chaperone GroES n=1 Tax=Paraclostridium dentum TaxID=2662455 RepID=UPI003F38E5EE
MTLQPIGDNVVLKITEKKKEEKTSSGLILLNSGTQQSLRTDIGEVIAVGEGRMLNNGQLLPLTAKVGQEVLYNKYAGTEIVVDSEKYLILKETDLLAVVK